MAITLKSLIQLAPFPDKEREMLLAKYDHLTEDDKYNLANKIWEILSLQYFSKLDYEKEKILLEIQAGKRQYNPNDFEEAKARLTHELSQKLDEVGSQSTIDEVKEQIEKYKTKSLPQDKSDIASSVGKPQV